MTSLFSRIVIEIPADQEPIAPQLGRPEVAKEGSEHTVIEIPAVEEKITPPQVGTSKVMKAGSEIPPNPETGLGIPKTTKAGLEQGFIRRYRKIAWFLFCFAASHLAWEFVKLGFDHPIILVSKLTHYTWVVGLLRILSA